MPDKISESNKNDALKKKLTIAIEQLGNMSSTFSKLNIMQSPI